MEVLMSMLFISHSTKDKYFVNLLVALLEFHHIYAWYHKYDLQGGEKYRQEIQEALDNTDILGVISSKNSAKSEWVKKEIDLFLEKKPNSKIVPIRLDLTELNSIYPNLENYQAIDFTDCMLEGFKKLLKLFNTEFLPHTERRKPKERRDSERRSDIEKRKMDPSQRLRNGFVVTYCRLRKVDKFQKIYLDFKDNIYMREYLKIEASKYIFVSKEDQGIYDFGNIVDQAIDYIFEEIKKHDEVAKEGIGIAYVAEAIAYYIIDNYEIRFNHSRREDTVRRTLERRQRTR